MIEPANRLSTNLKDSFGEALFVGDIVIDLDRIDNTLQHCWLYHYVERIEGYAAYIRDFAAHNVGACCTPKRLGSWNDVEVINELIDAGEFKSAEEIELSVWELSAPQWYRKQKGYDFYED